MCARENEHKREVIDYVFCALCMVCLSRVVSWHGQDCNRHATSAKHLVDWDWTMSKYSDKNVVLQTYVFLILVVINNKRSSGITAKPVTAFPEICYVTRNLNNASRS